MNDKQREALRDTARYLRNVRPIDPDEVYEYLPEQPHPGVVKRALRDLAPELGLVEGADGSFTAVAETTVEPWADRADRGAAVEQVEDGAGASGPPTFRVAALPTVHERRLTDLLVEAYGPGWPEGESGRNHRERLREVKEDYLHGGDVEYDYVTALAYACYHLPGYYAAVQYVLDDLAQAGLLDRYVRVLDVGAGVGGPALGLTDYLPEDVLVDYHAVEPASAADVLDALLEKTGRNVHTTIHRETAEAFDPTGTLPALPADLRAEDDEEAAGGWDLVLFSNVLSELDDPSGTARRYLDATAADGTFLALAPADRNTAMGLRGVERALADRPDGATIWGPTLRLWPDAAPSDGGWSFDVRPDLSVPGFQSALDDACAAPDHEAGEFVNVDVQFAYSVLRRDGQRATEFRPSPEGYARLADSEDHVTDRVNVAALKLSRDLTDDPGANPLYRVGDGSQEGDHYAVLVDEDSLNAALRTADYGDLLLFERVLVLWNDDENAYNLVVDGEVVVDSVPVPS